MSESQREATRMKQGTVFLLKEAVGDLETGRVLWDDQE